MSDTTITVDAATGIDRAKIYRPSQVALILGCSARTVQRMATSGEIRCQRVGDRLKISGVNLIEYLTRADNQPAESAS
jgi:excisionase family DNA binding protein